MNTTVGDLKYCDTHSGSKFPLKQMFRMLTVLVKGELKKGIIF